MREPTNREKNYIQDVVINGMGGTGLPVSIFTNEDGHFKYFTIGGLRCFVMIEGGYDLSHYSKEEINFIKENG